MIFKLVQAKQATELHTPSFTQRIVHEVIKDGFLDTHVPTIRELYAINARPCWLRSNATCRKA